MCVHQHVTLAILVRVLTLGMSHHMQVQPDSAAYNTVLAALLDAEQLQGSLSIVNDMRLQRLPVETASCDRLVLMLMMTGELELACNVTQVRAGFFRYTFWTQSESHVRSQTHNSKSLRTSTSCSIAKQGKREYGVYVWPGVTVMICPLCTGLARAWASCGIRGLGSHGPPAERGWPSVESFSSHQDCTSGGTSGSSTSNLNDSVPCQDTTVSSMDNPLLSTQNYTIDQVCRHTSNRPEL